MVKAVLANTSSGFYRTAMMRGGTPATFAAAAMVNDFVIFWLFFQVFWFTNMVLGLPTVGWQLLGFLFAIAQSLYVGVGNLACLQKGRCAILRFILVCNF